MSGPEPDDDRDELIRELAAAGDRLLRDPALVRPDGTPYDAALLERMQGWAAAQPVAAQDATPDALDQHRELRIAVLVAMREELLRARSDGLYSSEALESALAVLDAEQISIELRGRR
ncbi:hypothetical protein [Nocardioides lianchengensis]|uniref:Monovalent cation:H+ antiporter, CPA1 family n=1 Tax=Nocardioides lianchengensis TaxID=1045774 RepID=A0A1G6YIB8_9ACTN|nr:hypothetical protein [Nocardioides lianchengensis]NYG09654.1 CPA1 family monovalent cation:H+ antiporter [Nocardioides lianchengensis]SDD89467.1 monovalent cation:H+ antiporter, CPA1 family [Nocardioides lianchengensis]